MKQIVICGAFNIGSTGDEAGLSALVSALEGEAEFTVMTRRPSEEYEKVYGVKTYRKLEYISREKAAGRNLRGFNGDESPHTVVALLHLLSCADLLILGPGDFLNEDCVRMMRGALPEMYTMAWMAQWVGCPVMIFAASGRVLSKTYAQLGAEWLLDTADVVTFRDRLTPKLLGYRGGHVFPDPVLAMRSESKHPEPNPNILAISVRDLSYKGEAVNKQYQQTIAEVIRMWVAQNTAHRVEMIPMFQDRHDGGYKDDVDIAKEIWDIARVRRVTLYNRLRLPWETEGLFMRAGRALTTRLHAAVFCARCGVPFVALAYEPKVDGFMDWIHTAAMRVTDPPERIFKNLPYAPTVQVPSGVIAIDGYARLVMKACKGKAT